MHQGRLVDKARDRSGSEAISGEKQSRGAVAARRGEGTALVGSQV